MILLEIGNSLDFLIYLIGAFWLIPIVMFIIGLVRLKKKPKSAKILLIISGIWLVVGGGWCGGLLGMY
ncbi:MAG: hypothetical protein ACPG49_11980 [Chitinophagales bacterium]